MESTVHFEAVVRPWRAATLVASGLAALELVVVIVLAVALLASGGDEPARASDKQAAKRPTVLPRAKTRVLVLNGNGQNGAAAATAEQVKSFRYRIAAVGNADRSDYGRTTVLYRPGRRPEARRLARDLGVRLVGPLDGMGRGRLQGAHVAVIVGN